MSDLVSREKRADLHLPVRLSGQDAAGSDFAESTRSVNISGGGICVETRRNLLVGLRLLLEIQVPPPLRKHFGERALYRARAVICRVERFEGQDISRIGARFVGEAQG
jgi:hypothetical protein